MSNSTIAVLVVLIVVLVIAIPLLVIWCVNTLFGAGVEYTLLNWFAMFLLNALVGGVSNSK